MTESRTRSWQKTISALLLLAVGVSVPLVAILWDRVGGAQTTYFTGQSLDASGGAAGLQAFDLPAGVSNLSGLARDEKQYLMKLLFECLEKGPEKGPAGMSPPPGRCSEEASTPVLVTVYGPRGERVRVQGMQGTPAASVREAVSKLRDRKMFGPDRIPVDQLRARIDIPTAALPLSAGQKKLFEREGPVQPAGVVLAGEEETFFFLPADLADYGVTAPAGMLRQLRGQAAPPEEPRKAKDWPVSRIEAVSFANTAPGAHECMDTPRGMPIGAEVTQKSLLESCRGAAAFLARAQARNGSLAPVCRVHPGSLVGSNPAGRDAAIIYSLARYYGLSEEQRYREVCMRGLARLFRLVYKGKDDSAAAYIWEKDDGPDEVSLGTTALALCAFCEFRKADDHQSFDDLIGRLGDFLKLMQKEDGSFHMRYLPDEAEPGGKEVSTAQERLESAQAALGLTLAYRELRKPRFLLAARNALSALKNVCATAPDGKTGPRAGAAWFSFALREMFAALPAEHYAKNASRLAEAARQRQIGREDALWTGLEGAAAKPYPPRTGPTARDLALMVAAKQISRMGQPDNGKQSEPPGDDLAAARNTAGYLLQMQVTPRSGYFLPRGSAAFGGLLEETGGPVVNSATVHFALNGLTRLATLLNSKTGSKE